MKILIKKLSIVALFAFFISSSVQAEYITQATGTVTVFCKEGTVCRHASLNFFQEDLTKLASITVSNNLQASIPTNAASLSITGINSKNTHLQANIDPTVSYTITKENNPLVKIDTITKGLFSLEKNNKWAIKKNN